ncbi:hypothetical protein [Anabaena subtropica]|uniref:Uncharacterized protein n=1 Tax=Anabaena subtropica FACHB-260 TaxID=2692884 RepID=A0ABR8CSY9_9NOST|nr:hypothetical protein [Anabaena subtropica]MBD2344895.1 hypothetical protein [Anabaena subtropica FACHB-260]
MKFNSALTTAFVVAGVITLGGVNLTSIQPAIAQRISPGEVWQQVYQQLPDFPRENQYTSRETGRVAENNTLASRLIRYHVYVKERAPNYRLDWKLTLADYLDANEIMYDSTYPGNDTLRQNPIEGDRAAISRLNRNQRNALVQVLTNIFNPNTTTQPTPRPSTSTSPNTPNTTLPQTGGAELLK